MEPLGGIGRHGIALLKRIARIAASPAGRDGTVYHHTCRSFLPHHARRIVRSAVLEDARAMRMKVSAALSLAAHFATPLVHKPASLSFVLGPPGPALVRFFLVCVSVPCFF